MREHRVILEMIIAINITCLSDRINKTPVPEK